MMRAEILSKTFLFWVDFYSFLWLTKTNTGTNCAATMTLSQLYIELNSLIVICYMIVCSGLITLRESTQRLWGDNKTGNRKTRLCPLGGNRCFQIWRQHWQHLDNCHSCTEHIWWIRWCSPDATSFSIFPPPFRLALCALAGALLRLPWDLRKESRPPWCWRGSACPGVKFSREEMGDSVTALPHCPGLSWVFSHRPWKSGLVCLSSSGSRTLFFGICHLAASSFSSSLPWSDISYSPSPLSWLVEPPPFCVFISSFVPCTKRSDWYAGFTLSSAVALE